ncbi:hypothetical protein IKQ21_04340, partial [bacterium]|nr:hypothetical protein [bacterium]
LRDAKTTENAKFQTEFEAFKAANGAVTVNETDEYKKLVQTAKEKQQALTAKKESLIADEIKKLQAKPAETRVAEIYEAINHNAKETAKAVSYYEKLKNDKSADPKRVQAALDKLHRREKEGEELAAKIAEKLKYTGIGKAADDQKKAAKETYHQYIKDKVTKNMQKIDTPALDSTETAMVKEYTKRLNAVNAENEAFEKALGDIAEIRGMKKNKITIDSVRNQSFIASQYETKQIRRLEALKTALQEANVNVNAQSGNIADYVIKGKIGVKDVELLVNGKVTPTLKDEIKKYMDTLTENDRKVLEKILNGDITEENINKAIEVSTKRQQTLYSAGQIIQNHDANIEQLTRDANEQLAAIRTQVNDTKAYVKEGVLYNQKGEVIKTAGRRPAQNLKVEIQLPKGVIMPENGVQIEYQVGGSKLSAEELKEAALKNIKEESYKVEQEAFNAAEAARKTAYEKLDKTTADEAEQLSKFLKEKCGGAASQEEYVAKQIESKKASFIEKYGKQLESKLGKNAGWKLAAITAGGVLLGGLIGKLIAPKGDQA